MYVIAGNSPEVICGYLVVSTEKNRTDYDSSVGKSKIKPRTVRLASCWKLLESCFPIDRASRDGGRPSLSLRKQVSVSIGDAEDECHHSWALTDFLDEKRSSGEQAHVANP